MEENMEGRELNEEKEQKTDKSKKKKRGRKRRTVRRIIWILVILAVLAAGGYVAMSRLKADYTVTYDPYTAVRGTISNSLSFTGTMQLIDSATYTASADAKVREIYVSAGDSVKDGDRLIRLSNGETIEAEFDGKVNTIEVEKGDEVLAGDTLITVADFDHMKVSVRVGESNISEVYTGQRCNVSVSSAGAEFTSVIDKIDYVSYTGNNVAYYTTTVNVDTSETDNIYPGMQATVTIPLEEAKDVIVLKMDALSTARDNTAFVYKQAEDGTMESSEVTVGVSNGNYVEIKSGVDEGETVYVIARTEEDATGLSGLFSSMFGSQQVNRGGSGFPGGGSMPDMGSGERPGGNWNREGGTGGGNRGN